MVCHCKALSLPLLYTLPRVHSGMLRLVKCMLALPCFKNALQCHCYTVCLTLPMVFTPYLLGCRAPVVALKTSVAGNSSRPSGAYAQYQDPYALSLGIQTAAPGAGSFTTMQQCLDACDQVADCAGVTIQMLVNVAARPTTCAFLTGINDALQEARSFVKADATRLSYPELI